MSGTHDVLNIAQQDQAEVCQDPKSGSNSIQRKMTHATGLTHPAVSSQCNGRFSLLQYVRGPSTQSTSR